MKDAYLIVLETSESGFSAYSPDVWGCIATGETLQETVENMRSALAFHLRDRETLPPARGVDAYLDALRDSEGEEFFLTHLAIASLVQV